MARECRAVDVNNIPLHASILANHAFFYACDRHSQHVNTSPWRKPGADTKLCDCADLVSAFGVEPPSSSETLDIGAEGIQSVVICHFGQAIELSGKCSFHRSTMAVMDTIEMSQMRVVAQINAPLASDCGVHSGLSADSRLH